MTPTPAEPGSSARRLAGNSAKVMAAQMVIRLMSVVALVMVANRVEPHTYGLYNTALVFAANWAVLVQFGLRVPLLRAMAREPEHAAQIMAQVLALRLLVSLATAASAGLWGWYSFPTGHSRTLFGLLLLASLINSLQLTFDETLQSNEHFGRAAWCALVNGAVVNVGMIVGALLGRPIAWAVGSQVVAALVSFALLARYAGRALRAFPLRLFWSGPLAAELVKLGAGAAATMVIGVWYGRVDLLLARHFLGDTPVGHYSVPLRALDMALAATMSVAFTAQPLLSRSAAREDGSVYQQAASLLRLGAAVLVPICLIMDDLSWLLMRLFKPEYRDNTHAAGALGILIWVILWTYIGAVIHHLLFLAGRGWWVTACLLVGLFTALGSGLWLVPHYGIAGAATARLLGEMAVCGASIVALRQLTRMGWTTIVLKPAGLGLAMAAVWVLWPAGPWGLRSPLCLLTYLVLAWLIKPVNAEEWRTIRQALRRRPRRRPADGPTVVDSARG